MLPVPGWSVPAEYIHKDGKVTGLSLIMMDGLFSSLIVPHMDRILGMRR